MKKTFLILALAAATAATSCSKEHTEEVAYGIGITTWYSTSLTEDLLLVENYIASLGIPSNFVVHKGKGKNKSEAVADADAKAKKDADLWVAKFKTEDIAQLGLNPNTHFRWTVSRYSDPTDPDSDLIIIGEFRWNME